jgi:hypothetical protein
MITNITKHLGILRKLKFSLNRSNLEKMYLVYIRPLFEYACEVCGAIPHFILKNNWSCLRYLRSDSVSQPVSAYKYSDCVKMGKPVTILAASN